MYLDWLIADHQGTYPGNLAQTQDVPLFLHCTSHGQSICSTCHLQIGRPGHDASPLDHVIGQEKLLTVKGRTEPLLEEIRDIVLHQRMQYGGACGQPPVGGRLVPTLRLVSNSFSLAPRGDGCGYIRGGGPIAFMGKRISWQTDPMW